MKGKLLIIGFGPGSFEHITQRAREAIQESDVVIGYNTYVDLIRGLLSDQQVVRTGMTEEVSRAQEAVRQAEAGLKVAVISSGDAGVYGMAGLVYEVLMERGWRKETGVEVEVIPGISAINSTASLLGAPVMHDACTISLSDHLTPWELIIRRVEAAAAADFVIALYNPRSGRRTRQIVETQKMLLKYRSPDTPVGIVKSAYRDRQEIEVTTLEAMLEHDIGMLTTVIIGNSTTVVYDGLMITPRGYQRKYTLGADVQPLRPHERLRQEAEPWSLEATAAGGAAAQQASERASWPVGDEDDGWEADEAAGGAAAQQASERAWPVGDEDDGWEAEEAAGGAAAQQASERAWLVGDEDDGWEAEEAAGGAAHDAAVLRAAVRPAGGSAAPVGDSPAAAAAGVPASSAAVAVAEREAAPAAAGGAGPLALALEALGRVSGLGAAPAAAGAAAAAKLFRQEAILEFAVSPGLAEKRITSAQMMLLAEVVGEKGSMEYTPHHQLLIRLKTADPDSVTKRLRAAGLLLAPVGDVVQLKACDFCNMDKGDSVPYLEQIHGKLGGMKVPKELKIGFNGCGMACYGAVKEDIGIVYRREKFDLFLGGKTVGRNAHPGVPVAEGIEPDRLIETIERIVRGYADKGHPNERFHKYFARVKEVEGFKYREPAAFEIENALCGD
ncbi:precorrin-3B C(17)-methyltransferase [Paenibacillus mucilaginosus]|uniref:precorrin-3B C(17)-methyltransferase n=2 Tax=Paenibacillus mucilaginosus TaxID=61624 RepID=UPI0023792182|nr:precorrin-3B C(17)-methyltransferase [Paenibacillus mucilaginosus]WDM26809.1 precorrin-3B C(17)-methyltransferase [Paenibacillus mucilaginosus]